MSKNKSLLAVLLFTVLCLFATPVHKAEAQVATIDLSQLSVIKDTMQIVNQQLQQLQELTNIQQDILNAIGDATGIDPNSILFQGLMELVCGKFQLPQIVFNLPIPNLPYLDLPDSLCDWFGMGDNYQSNLWQRVFGRIENSTEYVRGMYFIDTQSKQFTDAYAATGQNAICAMYKMRNDMFGTNYPCPPQYVSTPQRWQPGQDVPVPVDIQLQMRRDRKQAQQQSIIFGQGLGLTSVTTAGNAGAQIQNMTDSAKSAKTVNEQLAVQNAILIRLYEQNAQIIALLGATLDMQGKDMMQGQDIVLIPAPQSGK